MRSRTCTEVRWHACIPCAAFCNYQVSPACGDCVPQPPTAFKTTANSGELSPPTLVIADGFP